ncbi:unnamed protein product [Chondrus crispus]|uniref:Uncharacterized protein n=1 Tax=Chondrus crispus TaxID=2769 RepID=R7Q6K4_CHOCR|nr:unnamed protein product [Chondrus crispus]CDF32986.1 unnamed protein product [Chondrus crispus]|eukprot:XP_005712789.1 unnamed protein product [Chondrus crispus]
MRIEIRHSSFPFTPLRNPLLHYISPPERPCTSASLLDLQLHFPSRLFFRFLLTDGHHGQRQYELHTFCVAEARGLECYPQAPWSWPPFPTSRFPWFPSIPRLPPSDPPSQPIFQPTPQINPSPRRYASLAELHDKSMRAHPLLLAAAPWFCDLGVLDSVNIENKFANGAGILPGHLPLVGIHSYDWRAGIAVPPSILRGSSPHGFHTLSARFISAVCDRLELPLTDGLIPASYFCDTWQYRTEGERSYLDSMINWTARDPVRDANRLWYNQRTATNEAMFWTRAIIPENFRHLKRENLPFFQHTVRAERRLRSDTGYFVAYHMLEAREIARDHYTNRYQKIPSWWGQFEVCQGFWAELGPVLAYYGRYLSDPRHGLWVVFLTEWCVKVAATLLWETYECWRLWFLPLKLIELMGLLDFTVPLGGADVDSEVHSLLEKIESVSWDAIPCQNSSRSFTHQHPSFSPGQAHCAAGDFAWFNPWSGSLFSAAEAQLSRRFGNQIPLPVTELVIPTDPRVSNICTRPSPPSSLRPRVTPATSSVAPAAPSTSIVQPVSPAVPSIRLRSQLVHPPPSLPARALAPAPALEIRSPRPEVTESLSVRALPKSGGELTPLLLSPKRDLKPASREATSPSPKNSQRDCLTSESYASLLRAHGLRRNEL